MNPPHGTCRLAPSGWWCSLDAGHDGPCPARPEWWNVRLLPNRIRKWR